MTTTVRQNIDHPAAPGPDFAGLFADLQATFKSGPYPRPGLASRQLSALERMMTEREAEIIEALRQDLGKPALESWTAEISYVAGDAAYCRKKLKQWAKPRKVYTPSVAQPGKSWLQPEPLGTVLIIGAWNYPTAARARRLRGGDRRWQLRNSEAVGTRARHLASHGENCARVYGHRLRARCRRRRP